VQLELSHLEVQQACTNRATIGQMNSNGQVLEWSQRLSLPYDSSEGADKARFSKGNWHAPGPPWMEPDPEIMQHLRRPSVSQNLERLVQSHPSSRTISPRTISPKQPIQLRCQLMMHYFHQFNIYLAKIPIPCINPSFSSVKVQVLFSSTQHSISKSSLYASSFCLIEGRIVFINTTCS